MKDHFLTDREIQEIGFKKVGCDVKISENSVFYQPEKMCFGNHIRIDDFCKLTGNITLGSYVHIASYALLAGRFGITVEDFGSISMGCILFSASDDYSGEYLINPTIPEQFTQVTGGPIILKKHTIIGAGTIVFPNVELKEGCAVGAASLVTKNLDSWKIYKGIPCKEFKERKKDLLSLEQKLKETIRE